MTNGMTVLVRSFGCRLNQAEGAQIEAAFDAAGFTRVKFGIPSDVIVVNTCSVTSKAETEGIKLLRFFHNSQPEALIVLTGCAVVTADLEDLEDVVDLVVPHAQKDRLPALVAQRLDCGFSLVPAFPKPRTQRAAVKVQDGCENFCTYCIVPFARGTPQSRPFDDCLTEARLLIESGYQELIVTGCNTATYKDSGKNLIDLLKALLALPGLGRLRLSSIEPNTLELDIAKLMLDEPKLCRYLHLPIQSGSNVTLSRMGRNYKIDQVRATLDKIYEMMPDISIGTDLIAGFPGETEEGFAHSYGLVESYPFCKVHVFPYSERPKTAAAEMPDQISSAGRKRRARKLIQLAEEKRAEYMQRFIGREITILVESVDPRGHGHGWSAEYLECDVKGLTRDNVRKLHTFTPTKIRNDMFVNFDTR